MTCCLNIKVSVDPGSEIANACGDAIRLADKLEQCVEFYFNEVHCMATPGGSHQVLVTNFYRAANRKEGMKIATCFV